MTPHPEIEGDSNQLPLPGVDVPPEPLAVMVALANRLVQKKTLHDTKSLELQELTDEIKQVEEVMLPDMMRSLGLEEIQLTSGQRLKLGSVFYANISKDKAPDAFAWLRSKNMGGVIKSHLVVDAALEASLRDSEIPHSKVETIHPSTLKSFVKEQCEADPEFPRALFGVHEVSKVTVK